MIDSRNNQLGGTGAGPALRAAAGHPVWPVIPEPQGAALLALLYQLEKSQWWSADQLWSHQKRQLTDLIAHAYRTVPFYRSRLKAARFNPGKKVTDELWQRLPILTREEVQQAGENLRSVSTPKAHGDTFSVSTSGSTALPVTVLKTELTGQYYDAINCRDQIWHRRDLSGMFCAIRPEFDVKAAGYPHGIQRKDLGAPTAHVFETGPCSILHVHTAIEDQVRWLKRKNPSSLLTVASTLHGIAKHCIEHGITLPKLRHVEAIGEVLTDEIRSACSEAWGVEVVDLYSGVEVGYMALQCPDHHHYHVQSETILVEILDEEGQPCKPGETGRVVVTPLHNYAMPLIRYAVGDYAVAGGPCPCGRGLPVIEKILGRTRNMLHVPGGRRFFPNLMGQIYAELAPVKQYQILQKTLEALEVRLVTSRPMTSGEEDAVRGFIQQRLDYPFEITFTYPKVIERAVSGKFEEFKSELPAELVSS